MANKETARLENWCVTYLQVDPYTPPECAPVGLHGTVFGHHNFDDGDTITTSTISKVTREGDNLIVVTRSGTEYLLGAVDPLYESEYPNARERIAKTYAV